MIVLTFVFISADMEVGFDDSNIPRVVMEPQAAVLTGGVTNLTGNLTNISEMDDTTIDDTATVDDDVLAWDTTTDSWITKAIDTIISFFTQAQVDDMIQGNRTELESEIASVNTTENIEALGFTTGAAQAGIWENVSDVATFNGNINISNLTMESKTEYSTSEIYVEVNSTTYTIWL